MHAYDMMTDWSAMHENSPPRLRPCQLNHRTLTALILAVLNCSNAVIAIEAEDLIPSVKQLRANPGVLDLRTCRIAQLADSLANEADILTEFLRGRSISIGSKGVLIRLQIEEPTLPAIPSAYRESIIDQAYTLSIGADGVAIRARAPAGIFYGIQTLKQLIRDDRTAPHLEITDWPDLAFRGVMVDPARANENAQYYERLIEFCGRYKLNRIHLHLTDDQSVTLYHEKYLPLMHPNAATTDSVRRLVHRARRLHIELIPEIESLGHARVFLRHPDFAEFLHQTQRNTPEGSWVGTTQPGFTNVLCPASERAVTFLADMYERSASVFPNPVIHIGCDEVDITRCSRCDAAFPGLSSAEWFRRHLLNCQSLAARYGRRVALWGDMLLKQPQILDGLSTEDFIIYDWHYQPEVSEKSVALFRKRGFEVVACPALMCHPHMVLPTNANYANIRNFAGIAREHDLLGLDTTIWIPTRYLSDVLWTGIAYAAQHAWNAGRSGDAAFLNAFAANFFGLPQANTFAKPFSIIGDVDWKLDRHRLSCWSDEDSMTRARREATSDWVADAEQNLAVLNAALDDLAKLRADVTANQIAWQALEQSVNIKAYVIEHFLFAARTSDGVPLDKERLRQLDQKCVQMIGWIEADWDRNRFPKDPAKDDIYHSGQHLLHQFRKMHEHHIRMLADTAD